MTIRARSLLSNSLSSVVASGLLIFVTVLLPAVLARALNRADYDLLATVLAVLPLLSIIPQSLRTSAASQLAFAATQAPDLLVSRVYLIFSLQIMAALSLLAVIGIEVYVWLDTAHEGRHWLLRMGLYCAAGHALGLAAIGLSSGPAAARRDFLPENFAKLWPGFYHLIGIMLVWLLVPPTPLVLISLIYLTSSWTVAGLLATRLWRSIYIGEAGWRSLALMRAFRSGLRGATWWNLTAWMATSASILIVSLQQPESIVPFTIASSLLGITSAGLIALSGPISGYAVAMVARPPAERRRFFLRVNTLFQAYVGVTAVIVLVLPRELFVLWLTPSLAEEVRGLCLLLLPSYMIRLMTMAFTVMVMSVGRQATIWFSPLVEAVISILGCVLLGALLGMQGIALALTLSAVVRLILLVVHDERITATALELRRGDTLLSGPRLLGDR